MSSPSHHPLDRRAFLTRSATSLAALGVAGFPLVSRGKDLASDPLKLALVGCGGRGAGAASQALNADSNTKLVAVADLFPDKLAIGLKSLQAAHPEQVDVP